MADIKSKEERSRNMASIRSENTTPEIIFRKWFFEEGYRYRLHVKTVSGTPDLYLSKYRTAIFVHGCFWHRHPGCKYAYVPKSRVEFWDRKFAANVQRDATVRALLEADHIKCLIIWECTIRTMKKDNDFKERVLESVKDFLNNTEGYLEL